LPEFFVKVSAALTIRELGNMIRRECESRDKKYQSKTLYIPTCIKGDHCNLLNFEDKKLLELLPGIEPGPFWTRS
jgi:hypothetical protein